MNHLFLSFEKPLFNLIQHGDIPSSHGDIPVVLYHIIEIELKTTVAKTEGLSKFLPLWSMFKDASSVKDVGSTLARSTRSDSLFIRNISLSKLQRSSFELNNLHYSHFHFVNIFLCSQWYSKSNLIGGLSWIILDYVSKVSKNKIGQSHIVLIFIWTEVWRAGDAKPPDWGSPLEENKGQELIMFAILRIV